MNQDIRTLVEEHPDVMKLKEEIERRTRRLHLEILALGISLDNIERFLKLYRMFHLKMCNTDPRGYRHEKILDDFLANGDLLGEGKDKSDDWLKWQLCEVERTLRGIKRYPVLFAHNRRLVKENTRLTYENKKLKEKNGASKIMAGRYVKENTDLTNEIKRLKEKNEELEEKVARYVPEMTNEDSDYMVEDELLRELLKQPIWGLQFSVRVLNALKWFDVYVIGDLVNLKAEDLMKCRNFGRKSLEEIEDKLESIGLSLDMNIRRKDVESV